MDHAIILNRDAIADEIGRLHQGIMVGVKTSIAAAIHIGELLAKKRAECRHGEWLPWVQSLPFSRQTADRYQMLYNRKEDVQEKLPKLGNLTSALRLVSGKQHQPVEGEANPPDPDIPDFCKSLEQLDGQRFGTIYADPPWRYSNQGTRAATDNHYDTMTVEDICALPVGELAADKAHLHLWTTNAFIFDAPRIFAAWGFEFKSSFVWVKPQMGIGNYWRNSHEILLLAVRGGQTALDKGQMSWVEARRNAHSEKPECIRERIEKLSPGPRLELFGRCPVPGWTVFGNQILREKRML